MWVLAITTSTSKGGVALAEEGGKVLERDLGSGFIHGRELHPTMAALLKERGLNVGDLGLVVVDVGPGSYTGTRVGVAAAKGLAFALKIPVVGVCSLDTMAWDAHANGVRGPIVAVLDAKWKQVYARSYRVTDSGPEPLGGPQAIRPDLLLQQMDRDSRFWGDDVESLTPRVAPRFPPPGGLLRLGLEAFRTTGPNNLMELTPLYLRPTEAEARLRGLPLP